MPKRTFICGGPVVPEENYFVKRERELEDFLRRVEQGKYIVIFAPRQTGKTTFFYQALSILEKDPAYISIPLNFEVYSEDEPERFYQLVGERIVRRVEERLQTLDIPGLDKVHAWLSTQENGICLIDNPIYQEIIIKTFTPFINGVEDKYLPDDVGDFTDYLSQIGEIRMDNLLDNFCDFVGRSGYKILEVPETPQEFVGQYLLLGSLRSKLLNEVNIP